ncbi:MAG: hypothetical protein WB615_10975 [Candidatus Tumulicola sp.]
MRHVCTALVFAILFVTATGCAHVPYAISDDDRSRFGKDLIVVHLPGHNDPLILGASGCKLYRARIEHQDIVGWEVTLAADWGAPAYPQFMTGCMRESLAWDGTYVKVYFCALAFGAGGGCTNGGYYRSRTGTRPWWISDDGLHAWTVLPR